MKVWFDILTPKQFWFFTSIEKRLRELGVKVWLTSRRYEQLVPLIEGMGRNDIPLIGEYGGATLVGKLRASVRRAVELLDHVEAESPDISVSSGSFEAVRVSYGLRIKHMLLSDTPESPVNRFCVPLSERVMTPWIVPKRMWTAYGIKKSSILTYRGLDPQAWLSGFEPRDKILDAYGLEPFNYILLRMPETEASYLTGKDPSQVVRFIERLIEKVRDGKVVIMIRYSSHMKMLGHLGQRSIVIDRPVADHSLLYYASVFIGGGGTMTQESVLLGVPTVSIFPGRLPTIHRYLVKVGALRHFKSPDGALDAVLRILERLDYYRERQVRISEKIKRKTRDPAALIASWLKSYVERLGRNL